jgi:hypothetical protein
MAEVVLNSYLVDENDDYILTEFRERIIVGTFLSLTLEETMRAIGANAARSKKIRGVKSFEIRQSSDGSIWWLRVNRTHLIGLFPSQAAALSVLYGVFTYDDGNDEAILAVIEDQISKGVSVIESSGPVLNVLDIIQATSEVTVTVTDFDYADAIAGQSDVSNGVYLATQESSDGITWANPTINNIIGAPLTAGDDGPLLSRTTVDGRWSSVPEDSYIRPIIFSYDSSLVATVLKPGPSLFKDEIDNTVLAFDLDVSGAAVLGVPLILDNTAYAIPDDSDSVLEPGETVSYSYVWSREVPSITDLTVS